MSLFYAAYIPKEDPCLCQVSRNGQGVPVQYEWPTLSLLEPQFPQL